MYTSIMQVIQNLKAIFKTKDRLVGFDDWDCLIGCIIALERLAADIQMAAQAVEENSEAEGE